MLADTKLNEVIPDSDIGGQSTEDNQRINSPEINETIDIPKDDGNVLVNIARHCLKLRRWKHAPKSLNQKFNSEKVRGKSLPNAKRNTNFEGGKIRPPLQNLFDKWLTFGALVRLIGWETTLSLENEYGNRLEYPNDIKNEILNNNVWFLGSKFDQKIEAKNRPVAAIRVKIPEDAKDNLARPNTAEKVRKTVLSIKGDKASWAIWV
ncbi:hypothetical protein U1Q18_030523 [Sarracenia purpurea var. burkii]